MRSIGIYAHNEKMAAEGAIHPRVQGTHIGSDGEETCMMCMMSFFIIIKTTIPSILTD